MLVAGDAADAIAQIGARTTGVSRVLLAKAPHLAHALAENLAPLVVSQAPAYSHIVAAATTFGKNLLPRVAALLDVAPVSDVIAIDAADIFQRPIYAGNVIATVQSSDPIKVLSIRSTAFTAAGEQADAATISPIDAGQDSGKSRFDSQTLTVSSRPELAGARVVVSGGRALASQEQFHTVLEPLGRPAWAPPSAPVVLPSMPATPPTIIRSARPARSSPPSCISPSASLAPFSIWPA